jgi:5-(carboxyamino)imidazole ribonucleotide mutase
VAIDGAVNAALLAIRMLGISDENLRERMGEYQKELKEIVLLETFCLQSILQKQTFLP